MFKKIIVIGAAATLAATALTVQPATGVTFDTQKVLAALSTGPVTVNAVKRCATDANGNITKCEGRKVDAVPVQDLVLSLEYTLANRSAALPSIISRTGVKGCRYPDATQPDGFRYEVGVTLLAGPTKFASSKTTVRVNNDPPLETTPIAVNENFVSEAVCLDPALVAG